MKCIKMVCLLFVFIILIPMPAYANITCNDDTVSKSCTDCHRGCCSGHGGCTNNPNHGSGSNITDSSTTTRTTTTKKVEDKSVSNDDFKYFIFGTGAAVGSVVTYIINKKKH